MVVRIHNLTKWAKLEPGQALQLPGQHMRKVRIELNAPAPTRLDVLDGAVTTFLAVIQGHEVVEFSVSGEAFLSCTSDDDVWYFTNEGDNVAVSRPDAVSFTKIATRRARNPELERMMFKLEQNQLRREAKQADEIAALRAALAVRQQAEAAAMPSHDPETGEVIEDGTTGAADDPATAGSAGGEDSAAASAPSAKKAKGA